MTGAPAATTRDELLLYLSADGEDFFAVVTRPPAAGNGTGVVILSDARWVSTLGMNRFYVDLTRALAGSGFHAVRFDYLGVGESAGATRKYRLDAPLVAEARALATWLRDQGMERVVFLGTCYGARVALDAAAGTDLVDGVAMFPPVLRDHEKGERAASLPVSEMARRALRTRTVAALRSPSERRRYVRVARTKLRQLARPGQTGSEGGATRSGFEWVSPRFVDPLADLVGRGLQVLFLFGEDDDFYHDFKRGYAGPLGQVIEPAGDRVEVVTVPGRTHGLATIDTQQAVADALKSWLAERFGSDRAR